MAATPATLRAMFPEFASPAQYPDTLLQTWLGVSVKFVNADRWGDSTDLGVMLAACHRVALAKRAQKGGAGGAAPGANTGLLVSKSADGISASYDASAVTLAGAGHWNLTTYGLQYKELANLMGAGPVQVGVDDGSHSGAWPGVIQPPF